MNHFPHTYNAILLFNQLQSLKDANNKMNETIVALQELVSTLNETNGGSQGSNPQGQGIYFHPIYHSQSVTNIQVGQELVPWSNVSLTNILVN